VTSPPSFNSMPGLPNRYSNRLTDMATLLG
jgi:hypothetical protein